MKCPRCTGNLRRGLFCIGGKSLAASQASSGPGSRGRQSRSVLDLVGESPNLCSCSDSLILVTYQETFHCQGAPSESLISLKICLE